MDLLKQLPTQSTTMLHALVEEAQAILKKRMGEERKAAEREILALAERHGISLDMLSQRRANAGVKLFDTEGKKRTQKRTPRFKHPEKEGVTWDGCGHAPAWMKQYELEGGSREALRIPPNPAR